MPRRELDLPDLDAVVAEADSLCRHGYTKAGQWDLGQVCTHIAKPMRGVVEGIPAKFRVPWHVRLAVRVLGVKGKVLRTRRIREGVAIPKNLVPPAGLDEAQTVAELRAAVAAYKAYQGVVPRHPLFGTLTRAEWDEMILIHCFHHLSFLIPKKVD
jgi:hypothetical protein